MILGRVGRKTKANRRLSVLVWLGCSVLSMPNAPEFDELSKFAICRLKTKRPRNVDVGVLKRAVFWFNTKKPEVAATPNGLRRPL